MPSARLLGATVARLTPDQKVACSNHVGVRYFASYATASCLLLLKRDANQTEKIKDLTPT